MCLQSQMRERSILSYSDKEGWIEVVRFAEGLEAEEGICKARKDIPSREREQQVQKKSLEGWKEAWRI